MTLSEIRRRIDALKRRFARELAIIDLRRVTEAVANDWDPDAPRNRTPSSGASSKPASGCPPSSASAAASTTPAAKARSPTLTIWCSPCCPGPTTTATANCSAGTFRLSPPVPRYCRFRPITNRHYGFDAMPLIRISRCAIRRVHEHDSKDHETYRSAIRTIGAHE